MVDKVGNQINPKSKKKEITTFRTSGKYDS